MARINTGQLPTLPDSGSTNHVQRITPEGLIIQSTPSGHSQTTTRSGTVIQETPSGQQQATTAQGDVIQRLGTQPAASITGISPTLIPTLPGQPAPTFTGISPALVAPQPSTTFQPTVARGQVGLTGRAGFGNVFLSSPTTPQARTPQATTPQPAIPVQSRFQPSTIPRVVGQPPSLQRPRVSIRPDFQPTTPQPAIVQPSFPQPVTAIRPLTPVSGSAVTIGQAGGQVATENMIKEVNEATIRYHNLSLEDKINLLLYRIDQLTTNNGQR